MTERLYSCPQEDDEVISGLKDSFRQPLLWDQPLGNHGHVRTVVGALAELLTARLVGGVIHKTDYTATYCPDVSARGTYFESKAVGRNATVFVYGGRLAKDREFARRHRLVYVIWHHSADSRQATTVGQLERLVLASVRRVYVVPFAAVDAVCGTLKADRLNSKYGGSFERPEYGSGYRIRLSLLDRWVHEVFDGGLQVQAPGEGQGVHGEVERTGVAAVGH